MLQIAGGADAAVVHVFNARLPALPDDLGLQNRLRNAAAEYMDSIARSSPLDFGSEMLLH